MKFEEIISSLQKKDYHPVYFLMGEESFYIDKISDFISKNVLDQSEKDFNQHVFYGKDSEVSTILSAAKHRTSGRLFESATRFYHISYLL
jgi:DNA polymerase-3 subunit delta